MIGVALGLGAWLCCAAAAAVLLGRAVALADQHAGCCPHPGSEVPA